jgi:hypothetical protein
MHYEKERGVITRLLDKTISGEAMRGLAFAILGVIVALIAFHTAMNIPGAPQWLFCTVMHYSC